MSWGSGVACVCAIRKKKSFDSGCGCLALPKLASSNVTSARHRNDTFDGISGILFQKRKNAVAIVIIHQPANLVYRESHKKRQEKQKELRLAKIKKAPP
jgi:hypothetical protein